MKKHVIIAFWCNFILTGIVDSTTNAPACDLVSSDKSKCYIYRSRALTFVDSIAFCRDELQAELPSNFDPEDESSIAEDLGLFFWLDATFRLHHDQAKNRIQLLNPQDNFTERRWDFTAINLTIFWSNESYCAEAVPVPGEQASEGIVWAPKDCNQRSASVLCERRSLTPDTTTTISLSPTSEEQNLFNQTFSDGLAEEVFDSQIDTRRSRESDTGLLDAAILIVTRGSYYMDRVRKELIASLLAGLVFLIFLLTGRILIRKLRRSSSAYFTVQGTALVYVKTDLPQAEIPRNKCTSFIIRGCE